MASEQRGDFQEDARPVAGPAAAPVAERLILQLDSYEGPIDLLLDQARDQKVDLAHISILDLAEQYLAFVERAKELRLELAADYLVMAAWLAYLKSRLLLPDDEDEEEPTAAEMAAALQFQLRRLEAMRAAGQTLLNQPLLGRDRFARGAPEPTSVIRKPVYTVSLVDLLRAYGKQQRRGVVSAASLHIQATRLFSIDQAVERLTRMLGGRSGWSSLTALLPDTQEDPLLSRSALAATFAASLELAKAGKAELRQDSGFAPIYIRGRTR